VTVTVCVDVCVWVMWGSRPERSPRKMIFLNAAVSGVMVRTLACPVPVLSSFVLGDTLTRSVGCLTGTLSCMMTV